MFPFFANQAEGNQHVSGFAQAESAQVGTCFCHQSDLLITWPGPVGEISDRSDHKFHIWDPIKMKLLYHVSRHTDTIMCVCDVNLRSLNPSGQQRHRDHVEVDYIASCSLDRKVLLWPITAITKKQQHDSKAAGHSHSHGAHTSTHGHDAADATSTQQPQSSSSSSSVYELTGHKFAMRSLVYAPEHELLLGGGFDFDLYVWDPWTRLLSMRLTGHMTSVLMLKIAYIPHERVLSLDESGIIKVWVFCICTIPAFENVYVLYFRCGI